MPMRYGEDTGQVVKMRERGAQTVQGCEQAQCSRRGMEIIREMEIYAEALPGPNRAELHHYHHDDVVRTSAAPCRSHVFFHGVWNVMHASRAAGLARLWGALNIHTL